MNDSFDPYLNWLGIRDPERPPNHYRLLGLEPFESDAQVIATAADRQMAHIRTFQGGQNAELSQQILNELSAAKLCLLHGDSKQQYDEQLKERLPVAKTAEVSETPIVDAVAAKPATPVAPSVKIEANEDSLRLGRPRRGNRHSAAKRFQIPLLVVLGIVVAAGIYYWKTNNFGSDTEATNAQATQQSSDDPSDDVDNDESSTTSKEAISDPPADPPSDAIDDASPPIDTTTSDDAVRVVDDNPSEIPRESAAAPEPVTNPNIAPWDSSRENYQPLTIADASNPVSGFLLALSKRSVTTANVILDTLVKSPSVRKEETDVLSMLLLNSDRFWKSVAQAITELRPTTIMSYRGQRVTVITNSSNQIQLMAVNKERKSFDLDPQLMDIELALALVEKRHRQSLPTAWRLMGLIMCIDSQGDFTTGLQYLKRAESQGMSIEFELDALELLRRIANPKSFDIDDLGSDDARKPDRRFTVPGKGARAAAVRGLARTAGPIEQRTSVDRQETISRLFKALDEKKLNSTTEYAMLDLIRNMAHQNQDLRSALKAQIRMAKRFQVELSEELPEMVVQEGYSSHEIVDTVIELAKRELSIDQEAYAHVDTLLAFATQYSSGPTDKDRVVSFRVSYDETMDVIRRAQKGKVILSKDPEDSAANYSVGLFHFCVTNEFRDGLLFLAKGADRKLQQIAMADLLLHENRRPNSKIAALWTKLSDEYSGLLAAAMLKRADFWNAE